MLEHIPREPESVDLLRRIDATCDQFEDAWSAGLLPRVEEYLTAFSTEELPSILRALQSLQYELAISRPKSTPPQSMNTTQLMTVVTPDEHSQDKRCPQLPKSSAEASTPCVTFRVFEGPHEGVSFTFQEHNTLFAGRLPEAQLRLEKDRHFSRHHFRLEVNPPTCFLMDLKSLNGTFVNGEKVREQFLKDGDVVSGGRTKMLVSIFDPEDQRAPHPDRTLADSPVATARPMLAAKPVATPGGAAGKTTTTLTIPGYQIFDKIGEGDLGTIFRAFKESNREPCALKVLCPNDQADEKSAQTFLREASVLNKLDHPHIIRMIEMGAVGRTVYLAIEHVKAIDWNRLVQKFSIEKRIRVACGLIWQVLGALEYAHARSFVHRDIKPANILVTKKDEKLVAKLSDFGLAKQYTTAGMSQVTRDGEVLGSLPFMSPDQFLNSRDARPTCDIYSTGATLYWMLTGHEPIVLDGHDCKFLAILEARPTPIQERNSAIADPLAAIVHRALEKTPEKRFSSAAEMRHALRMATR